MPLKLAADLKPGPLDLKAKVSWLECKEACIPGSGSVEATLNIGDQTKPSADAAVFNLAEQSSKIGGRICSIRAWWEKPANGDTRPLIIECDPKSKTGHYVMANRDFFPDANDHFEIQAATENVRRISILVFGKS